MSAKYLQRVRHGQGLPPVADFLAGTLTTDVVQIKDYDVIRFNISKGAGATGTMVCKVLACDNFTPTTTVAVPFHYRAETTIGTLGAVTAVTTGATGFTTTAGATQEYLIEVHAADVVAAAKSTLDAVGVAMEFTAVASGVIACGVTFDAFDGTYQGETLVSPLA
jgi:hypothetical protein